MRHARWIAAGLLVAFMAPGTFADPTKPRLATIKDVLTQRKNDLEAQGNLDKAARKRLKDFVQCLKKLVAAKAGLGSEVSATRKVAKKLAKRFGTDMELGGLIVDSTVVLMGDLEIELASLARVIQDAEGVIPNRKRNRALKRLMRLRDTVTATRAALTQNEVLTGPFTFAKDPTPMGEIAKALKGLDRRSRGIDKAMGLVLDTPGQEIIPPVRPVEAGESGTMAYEYPNLPAFGGQPYTGQVTFASLRQDAGVGGMTREIVLSVVEDGVFARTVSLHLSGGAAASPVGVHQADGSPGAEAEIRVHGTFGYPDVFTPGTGTLTITHFDGGNGEVAGSALFSGGTNGGLNGFATQVVDFDLNAGN